jgi:large subunit ribosomal protein L29
MTKPAEIRTRSDDELAALLLDLKREQFNLRFQRATGQAEGTARVKQVRRDIARVMTIQAGRSRTASVQSREE